MATWPSIVGWYCSACEVAWHVDAEPVCWSCGSRTTVRATMPYPSVGAMVEEVTTSGRGRRRSGRDHGGRSTAVSALD